MSICPLFITSNAAVGIAAIDKFSLFISGFVCLCNQTTTKELGFGWIRPF